MDISERKRAGALASLGLAIPVATTLFYMATLGGPDAAGYGPGYEGFSAYITERGTDIVTVWTVEAVGFILCAIACFGLAAGQGAERAAWNAIALGSLGGFISTAMGISLFPGFGTAGEDHYPLFVAVLTGSFYFFFVGKALTAIGVAGLALGLVRHGNVLSKGLGVVAGLAGLVGFAANLKASATGLEGIMLGGATGVLATAFGALVAFVISRSVPS